ncbi:MAG: IS30 family transposase [Proteobacteria bacterium]|nr:IS30 family transposase [Desulfobulbaceae bacterium]MBU4154036.1 IS30 family transposase [Pseudomonadota bacterium]
MVDALKVHKSTISRELRRNVGERGWRPKQAQEKYVTHRLACHNANKFPPEDWAQVDVLIRDKLSPEQVSSRMVMEKTLKISHETIYMHVYNDKRAKGDLWLHLNSQKRYRKRYGSGQERSGTLKNRISIDDRPKIILSR